MSSTDQLAVLSIIFALTISPSIEASSVQDQSIGGLQMTLLGRSKAGSIARLAVSWGGSVATSIDGWADVDDDGRWTADEMVLDRVSVEPGISVLEFTMPENAVPCRSLRLRVVSLEGIETEAETKAASEGVGVCGWQEGFHVSDLDSSAEAIVVFDDGGGGDLYAGGWFTMANGLRVDHVARWNGGAWSPLGGGFTIAAPGSAHVTSLAVFDGELYAGGSFDTAGGVPAQNIARWDGFLWSAAAGGLVNNQGSIYVKSMTVWDDGGGSDLYVGGGFDEAGGVTLSNIARWDGSSWSALGTGVDNQVRAMQVFDDGGGGDLYVGGYFEDAGGSPASRIARWDGASWSALGAGIDEGVESLAVFDDGGGSDLYVGGEFYNAGGSPANNMARWDGTVWSTVGGGIGSDYGHVVHALQVYGGVLVAAGTFDTAGGSPANNVARWDGAAWSAMAEGTSGRIDCLAVFDDDGGGDALFVGGLFVGGGGSMTGHIARWRAESWSSLSPPMGLGVNASYISTMATWDDGSGEALYVGGWSLTSAGEVVTPGIARWDGSSWSSLGSGVDGMGVLALAVFDDGSGEALYVGKYYSGVGGTFWGGIVRWDGSAWSTVGSGVDGYVTALEVFDDGGGAELYAGGSFSMAGGVSVENTARWDGSVWSPVGSGTDDDINALRTHDDGSGPALYVGGSFDTAGGISSPGIARWDGSNWAAVGSGIDGWVVALESFDGGGGAGLYAGGDFDTAGGVSAANIARWNGSGWLAVDGGTDDMVIALAEIDDGGGGQALYVGGRFGVAGAITANGIARWTGSVWQAVHGPAGIGVEGSVSAMAEFRTDNHPLYVGGDFVAAGGVASKNIARWLCSAIFADGFESGDTDVWSNATP